MLERLNTEEPRFNTIGRMKGMLTVAREELNDVPLYYVLDDLCNIIHCSPPSMLQMRYVGHVLQL